MGWREYELARSLEAERRSNLPIGLIQTGSIRSAHFATHLRPKNQSATRSAANLPLLERSAKLRKNGIRALLELRW